MSAFTIFFIVVTVGYILYYAAIITIDMNQKPKGEGSNEESVDTGGLVAEQNDGDEDQNEEHDYKPTPSSDDDDTAISLGDVPEPNGSEYEYQQEEQDNISTPVVDNSYTEQETLEQECYEQETPAEQVDVQIPEDDATPDSQDEYNLIEGESNDADSDEDLSDEEKEALMAGFQSTMEKDEAISLVDPTVHEEEEIFDDPDEDKYEVKDMYGPENADEGDLARAINSTLEETQPESTMPMGQGLLYDAAMDRLGVELEGTSHYERT